jgi:hypothetical protein
MVVTGINPGTFFLPPIKPQYRPSLGFTKFQIGDMYLLSPNIFTPNLEGS